MVMITSDIQLKTAIEQLQLLKIERAKEYPVAVKFREGKAMQYARTALALESGLATMGMLLSHCECKHLENSEMRDLGHFIAALVPASQILRGISTLAGDVLTKHRLEEDGAR